VNGYHAMKAAGLPTNTTQVATPSGGLHLYYRVPPAVHTKSAFGGALEKAFGPGLDTRGDGGYVIVPPSIAANGKAYRWSNDLKITDALPVPAHLLCFITKPQRNGRGSKLTDAVTKIATATPGHRHGELNLQSYLVGQAVGAGRIDEKEARPALIEAG